MSILWALGGFFIVLTPVVLIHELGHFIAAKLSNIRVEEFGFGLPPRALKLAEKGGTIYSLNWIPLGGFVRPAGEDDPTIPGGFASASKRARLFVLSAGAGANFLAAIVIFWIALVLGPPAIAIGQVHEDSPAMKSGLMTDDVILEVNGTRTDNNGVLVQVVQENAGTPINLLILRNGEELMITLIPRQSGEYDAETDGPIGVTLKADTNGARISRGPVEAAIDSLGFMWDNISLYGRLPGMLLNGEISAQEARPVSVIGISQIAGISTN